MTYFTELHIGLWNAWMGSLLLFAIMMGMLANRNISRRMMDVSWYTPSDKRAAFASMVSMYAMMIFTVWVPLKIGTLWFFIGGGIYLLSLACFFFAVHDYTTTAEDEPIVRGVYRASRNPLYLFTSTMFLGLVVASLSLPLLLFWGVYNVCTHQIILGEERYCLKTHPETYGAYMEQVPRYLLFL